MLRMNFNSLPVTNSADGGRRSYPKLSKCNKTASFCPIPRWRKRLLPLVSQSPRRGMLPPSSGYPLAPPLHRLTRDKAKLIAVLINRKFEFSTDKYNEQPVS